MVDGNVHAIWQLQFGFGDDRHLQTVKDNPVNTLCMATFGVGLSWGFCVVNTSKTYVGGIRLYQTPSDKMTRKEKIKYWIDFFKEGNNA